MSPPLAALLALAASAAGVRPYANPDLPAEKRIDDLIAQLDRVEAELDRRLAAGAAD